jgi:hypothetical protein
MAVVDALGGRRSTATTSGVFLFLLGIIAAATWLIGGFGRTAPPPTTGPGGVGDTITFTDIDGNEGTVTLLSIRRSTEKAPDSRFAPDPINGSFLIAEFRVTATKGTVSMSSSDFTVAADGRTYVKTPVATPRYIDGGRLTQGHSVEGPVGFDVPIGHLRILFSDRAAPIAAFDVDG